MKNFTMNKFTIELLEENSIRTFLSFPSSSCLSDLFLSPESYLYKPNNNLNLLHFWLYFFSSIGFRFYSPLHDDFSQTFSCILMIRYNFFFSLFSSWLFVIMVIIRFNSPSIDLHHVVRTFLHHGKNHEKLFINYFSPFSEFRIWNKKSNI